MALRFWFGASGSGKTTAIHNEIIERAANNREMEFLIIVPDQFTMQTQKQMVSSHPDGGILNIDVLSFSRLAHRIFEEVGRADRPLLDDTGKCLILRRIMEECKEEIPLLAAGLRTPGFVQEVKSVLSEFMQYDLTPETVRKLSEFSFSKRPLALKLSELAKLYEAFLKVCNERFLTSEGTLHLLCERMEQSELLRRSVVVFDGFTGFTPIQNRVIEQLLIMTKEVNVVLVMDHRYSPYSLGDSTDLFALTCKTVHTLQKLAMANNVSMGNDVILEDMPVKRFVNNPEMAHLERMLFRTRTKPYESIEEPSHIEIVKAATLQQECSLCCKRIFELIHDKGYRYRDIAIVTSDMTAYEEVLKSRFDKYGIPHFIDNTGSLMQNPFVAYLRSFLAIVRNNFRYEDVFTFLRSGFTGFETAMTDRLDNYVRARGIRGYRMWSQPFRLPSRELRKKEERLGELEDMRVRLLDKIESLVLLAAGKEQTAEDWCRALYDFCVKEELEIKLKNFAQHFRETNNHALAKEYEQVYRLIMDLFDQIVSLLGDDKITLKEFSEILDAGLMEIRVASLPQGVDLLMVGDIERTRLKEIKALFLLGVNDGKIPRDNRKGGLISDLDREFLMESGTELAPTPAMQMFIQQLYLYMNLTKPEEYLWLSFALISEDGTALAPAYLITNIRELFPGLICKNCEEERPILATRDKKDVFSELLQSYLNEELEFNPDKKELLTVLCSDLAAEEPEWLEFALETAFVTYKPTMLEADNVRKLYGEILNCSISSLERFAACQYAHFLAYGLRLKEREEFSFDALDMGNLSHDILQHFGEELCRSGIEWETIQDEIMDSILKKVIAQVVSSGGNAFLSESDGNTFYLGQIHRILKRTVQTLRSHLKAGRFIPYDYERKFRRMYDNDTLLKGKVDRVDLYETDNEIMVKIIDYKTGSRDFDMSGLYYGLSLQLAVYMKQVMHQLESAHPDKTVTPAAMLYYRIHDPRISEDKVLTEEEVGESVLAGLNYKGIVCSREGVVESLDESFEGSSLAVPVKRDRKTAGIKESEHVVNTPAFNSILDYAEAKAVRLAHEIMQGGIACNPTEVGSYDACEYCAYRTSCGFDARIQGYRKAIRPEATLETILREGGNEYEV